MKIFLSIIYLLSLNFSYSQSISIANSSFESPALNDGAIASIGSVQDWIVSGGTVGIFNPSTSFYSDPAITTPGMIGNMSGVNAVFFSDNNQRTILQTLTENIIVGETYTLTVAVGDRDGGGRSGFAGYEIKLIAGGVTLNTASSSISPGDGTFTDVSLSYTAQAGDSGALGIEIGSFTPGGGLSVDFDNVRLTKGNIVTPSTTLTMTSPENRAIQQRSSLDNASITFSGSFTGSVATVEIMATDLNGNGNDIAWTVLDSTPASDNYSGDLLLNTGWYEVSIRSLDAANTVLNTETLSFFGVGDIFITTGQSNGANFGQVKQTATSNQVSYYNTGNLTWTHAQDPPVSAAELGGTGGSPWPILGDLLLEKDSNVPVAFAILNDGGSSVASWEPARNDNYPKLFTVLNAFGANGFRAVLWHQGESDRGNTTAAYVASLKNVISSSRTDGGWNIPWYVAIASTTDPEMYQQIADAQLEVIRGDDDVFLGSHTDDLIEINPATGVAWRHDGIHFSEAGLIEHANRWLGSLYRSDDIGSLTASVSTFENGKFKVDFLGVAGMTYVLKKSLNLQDNFPLNATGVNSTLFLNGFNTGTLIDSDPTASGSLNKAFYSIGINE